jgi:hypothetical protein
MNDDKLVTLFGSPTTPEQEGNNDLEAARAHGYLRLNDVKPVSDDEGQIKEREQLEAMITVIASL